MPDIRVTSAVGDAVTGTDTAATEPNPRAVKPHNSLDEVTARVDAYLDSELSRGARGAAPQAQRYTMGAQIARGGMGSVMLADDAALSRKVAVKILHGSDDESRRQLAREAGIAGRLEHPNIVPLYDAGVDAKGNPYLAMRYVEGETLRAVLVRLMEGDPETHKLWSFEARCRLALQLLSALKLAHARGVLHRDIKPDNVMIGPFGEVLLVDWGIACSPEESAGDVVGTARYMSPEQADGAKLDARTDVYSLSVLLYELLTLQHPLGDLPKGEVARLLAVATRTSTAAELVRNKHQPVVPRALSLVVMKGLARDRDQRWPSVDAMERALEQVLAGQAEIVCPHTAYARGLTAIGRVLDAYPRAVYVVTISVVVLALVGVVSVAGIALDVVSELRAH